MSQSPWFKCYQSDFLNGVSDLSPHEGWVYTICLMRMYDEGGSIPDEPERIARRCNMRLTQCKKTLSALANQGKIIRGDGLIWNNRVTKETKKRQEVSTKSAQAASSRWQKEKKKRNKFNGTTVQAHPPGNADAMPLEARSQKLEAREDIYSSFEEWYQHYPRKVGRGQAERAFRKAMKETDLDTLIASTQDYASQCAGKDPQFIKNPATWLNGKCWLDEETDTNQSILDAL